MSTQSFRYGNYLGLSDLLLDVLIIEDIINVCFSLIADCAHLNLAQGGH